LGYRILAVNWQDLKNPFSGGAEVHLHEILSRLGKWGHEITLLCSGFDGAPSEESYDNIRIIRRGRRINFNWVAWRHVQRLLVNEKYDLILEDINKIPFYLPKLTRVPVLAVVPHLFATTVFHEINIVLASYIYLMERPVNWWYTGCRWMVISESTKTDLVERGIRSEMISVIHCGIDHQLFCPDPQAPLFPRPTILYLGRLKKYKCVDHLFRAAARLPREIGDWQVVVVGGGDDRRRLESVALQLGIADRVTFAGFVDTAAKIDYLRRSQVAVCPSLKEGWGLTNIEANACGTPVIAANVPGLRDSVRDGKTGFLYRHGDIEALSGYLARILTDQGLRERLALGALEWSESFHWSEAARETEALITRVLHERRDRTGSK
jgi:glycosyltransferase involved in cell wall biosynthesis